MRARLTVIVFALLVGLVSAPNVDMAAQVPSDPCVGRTDGPCAFPRFDQTKIVHLGRITIPGRDSRGNQIDYGAGAAGFSEDGTQLYVGCRAVAGGSGNDGRGLIWTGTVPAIGGTSKEVAPCTGLSAAQVDQVVPGGGGYFSLLGGIIQKAGRMIASGYVTYDAEGPRATRRTWWTGPSLSALSGPVEGAVRNGLVMRMISRIPPEWQALLGGDLGVTAGYSSIISRSSYGHSFTTMWSKDVGTKTGFPMTFLLGCPYFDPATGQDLAKCISRWQHNSAPDLAHYGGSEEDAGTFIVPGTRTLVALAKEAKGPMCYGYATRVQADHGKPYRDAVYCYSLSDPLDQKGPKGWPYVFLAALYDLAHLVEVKAGARKPWDVEPYALHTMPTSSDSFAVGYTGSAAFHSQRGEHYLFRELFPDGKGGASVDVFGGFPREGTGPPPPTPPTGSFVSVPPTIATGGFSALRWTTTGATTATIMPGDVQASPVAGGEHQVSPAATTTYTLAMAGPGGAHALQVTVTVQDAPPTPTDCVLGQVVETVVEVTACLPDGQGGGTRTLFYDWVRVGDVEATNGGVACPLATGSGSRVEACEVEQPPPPPDLTITATGSTRTCTLVLTANHPPTTAAGWGVQFSRRVAGDDVWQSHGTRDTMAPYARAAAVTLGDYEGRAIWSRVGSAAVQVPAIAMWACVP